MYDNTTAACPVRGRTAKNTAIMFLFRLNDIKKKGFLRLSRWRHHLPEHTPNNVGNGPPTQTDENWIVQMGVFGGRKSSRMGADVISVSCRRRDYHLHHHI